eukprot:CAMPEP_0116966696 /NCGR_PEP_ID=MMETSP0467-20121206/50039_1 /TAXON_ID=283647 /ORGANISM="Mesodinium pulex, Strain SPMC105" /LENGTH=90 /DNA_ID=CAMNT_0004656323 /DNA_START=2136 /DNA_END=2408 /DNA_ORIENTATION=-
MSSSATVSLVPAESTSKVYSERRPTTACFVVASRPLFPMTDIESSPEFNTISPPFREHDMLNGFSFAMSLMILISVDLPTMVGPMKTTEL